MLSTRIIKIAGESQPIQIKKGCPQGGVLSPLLWNMVINELISKLNANHFYTDRKLPLSQNVEKLLNVTPDDLDAVLRHYKITPKGLQEIVISIQEWYEKQHHLPQGQLDDKIILQHLILKGFNMEKVKDKIDNFFSAKHKMPEILLKRDPLASDFDRYLRFAFFVILPKKTSINHRVSIFRLQRPFDFIAADVMKMAFMLLEYRILNDISLGEQWIFDLTNLSFQNSVQMTPVLITKLIYYIRFYFGSKIKGIHIVNMPAFVAPLLNIVKKIMKPKVAKRIYVYNNFDQIYEILPKNILPKEYGGDELSCQEIADEWRNAIQTDAWRTYFSEQDKLISDESKRTRFLSTDDFFGCEGSFKKLEVD
ncbi:unnamed protein product [Parnassius mnemosyne]|uniref:CRAL-TRIO domain-containing protein n=1 Tax=Parnassius mnemosyne TaxID=213953 RepID=A0AAV1L886_9NEOP